MTTASEKGNALERAVELIEKLLLSTSPALRGNPFIVESKKILTVGGVRHEIDVFVTVDCGYGYKSVFIFECKNRKDAVSKNDIIIFSEKIDVSSATKGLFVAKSFTKDAEAQAAKDNRISLHIATEHDVAETLARFKVRHIMFKEIKNKVGVQMRDAPAMGQQIDMTNKAFCLNGQLIDHDKYISEIASKSCSEKISKQFSSKKLADGEYADTATVVLKYVDGELMIGDGVVRAIKVSSTFVASIISPRILAHYDVAGRGWSIEFETIESSEGVFNYSIGMASGTT